MKRILLPAALALTASFAFAQAPQEPAQQTPAPIQRTAPDSTEGTHGMHHAQDPHRAAQRIGRQLNLSADQTAKLEPIFAARAQKMNDLNANTSLSPKDRRKQMHAIQSDTQQQLSTVLTPEQLDQVKSMRKGRHGKGEAEPLTPPSA